MEQTDYRWLLLRWLALCDGRGDVSFRVRQRFASVTLCPRRTSLSSLQPTSFVGGSDNKADGIHTGGSKRDNKVCLRGLLLLLLLLLLLFIHSCISSVDRALKPDAPSLSISIAQHV
jgi:hypothetical protein